MDNTRSKPSSSGDWGWFHTGDTREPTPEPKKDTPKSSPTHAVMQAASLQKITEVESASSADSLIFKFDGYSQKQPAKVSKAKPAVP